MDPQTVGSTREGDAPNGDTPTERKHGLPFWLELPLLIVIALVIAVVIKTFFMQAFYVRGSSMEDTLQNNERVMISKLAYRMGDVQRGHVAVLDDPRSNAAPDESVVAAAFRDVLESVGLSAPDDKLIKRVIGLPGERVEIVGNRVYIDGSPIDEPYVKAESVMTDFGPVLVPPGEVLVMGDNRGHSLDGRSFGTVPIDSVVGRAFVVMWPISHWSSL